MHYITIKYIYYLFFLDSETVLFRRETRTNAISKITLKKQCIYYYYIGDF